MNIIEQRVRELLWVFATSYLTTLDNTVDNKKIKEILQRGHNVIVDAVTEEMVALLLKFSKENIDYTTSISDFIRNKIKNGIPLTGNEEIPSEPLSANNTCN